MAKPGIFGEVLDILQEETEQGVVTAKQQITGKVPKNQTPQQSTSQTGQNQQQPAGDQVVSQDTDESSKVIVQSEDNKKFVQDLYGGSTSTISDVEKQKKELEDKQKTEALRQKLHGEYYEQLVTPPKAQEERPAEKQVREEEEKKIQEQQELEKKQQEELPTVVTKDMGTKEKLRGVSG